MNTMMLKMNRENRVESSPCQRKRKRQRDWNQNIRKERLNVDFVILIYKAVRSGFNKIIN